MTKRNTETSIPHSRQIKSNNRLPGKAPVVDPEQINMTMDIRFPFTAQEETPSFMNLRVDEGRRLKIINIGAGYTGLMCCIRIPRKFQNIEFKAYEKNPVPGGTWYENTYPGVACDM